MTSTLNKLRSFLPGTQNGAAPRESLILQPELGFTVTIETVHDESAASSSGSGGSTAEGIYGSNVSCLAQRPAVPELVVHLLAARHLPTTFGFKIVEGYMVKVKLFPGSMRFDSTIQTNSWPTFNEKFRFPLTSNMKSALKYSTRRGSKVETEYELEDLLSGQFVVLSIYALLDLPPESLSRFSRAYRSLRDKSSTLLQKVAEGKATGKENNASNGANGSTGDGPDKKVMKSKRQSTDGNPRDSMPPLTLSESKRNIGTATCYLETKIFKRNARKGVYATEELWLPVKDINKPMEKNSNLLENSVKGLVELSLQLRQLPDKETQLEANSSGNGVTIIDATHGSSNTIISSSTTSIAGSSVTTIGAGASADAGASSTSATKGLQWNRMTSEMKRKMGLSNVPKAKLDRHSFELRVATVRMRCSHRVKDELEANAATGVYVKTTVFVHGIYMDSWRSNVFYPSLSTKWQLGDSDATTLVIPLRDLDSLDSVIVQTTLATKKMGKKIVLGSVVVGKMGGSRSGYEQLSVVRVAGVGERCAMWHSFT